MLLPALTLVSAGAFFFYSFGTLFKTSAQREYERYGVPRLQAFVGCTQLLGALGLLLGLRFVPLGALAAGGLTLMMVLGLAVRVRIHDSPKLMIPAATLAAINGWLLVLYLF